MMQPNTSPHAAAQIRYCNEYRRIQKDLVGAAREQMQSLRETAMQRFSSDGFPTLKHPDWKYTSLVPLLSIPFICTLRPSSREPSLAHEKLGSITTPTQTRLVFVDGHFSMSLSQVYALPKHVVLTHLASVIQHHPERLPDHWQHAASQEVNSFISLNTGFMQDGAYLYLPADTVLNSPIELLFITTREGSFIPVRNLIIAEKNTRAVIIEKYSSLSKTNIHYFTNTVSECLLAAESHIEHYKLLEEGGNAFHIGNCIVAQQEKSQFLSYSIALTGALLRSDIRLKLCKEQAQCRLRGLYYASERQYIDHHTLIDQLAPYTHSNEFYKGIVDDQAQAVFNGKLILRNQALQSSANQLNKNLLLSSTAKVHTKPQLEVFVDDTQCTHGASIGQIDEAALFYLRARGLDHSTAKTLLIQAFMDDIIQQIPLLNEHPSLTAILGKLPVFRHAQT